MLYNIIVLQHVKLFIDKKRLLILRKDRENEKYIRIGNEDHEADMGHG